MPIDKKALDAFKELYEEEFKEKISDQEAEERFSRLINVLRVIVTPSEKSQDHELFS